MLVIGYHSVPCFSVFKNSHRNLIFRTKNKFLYLYFFIFLFLVYKIVFSSFNFLNSVYFFRNFKKHYTSLFFSSFFKGKVNFPLFWYLLSLNKHRRLISFIFTLIFLIVLKWFIFSVIFHTSKIYIIKFRNKTIHGI